MTIKQRKKEHVDLSVSGEVDYIKSTGFDAFEFVHNALPEVNFDEIHTKAHLLKRTFDFPLFISSMTGGYTEAGAVNAIIAAFCEKYNLPFGVGSQRIILEDPGAVETFSIVRKEAPNAFIASNIGGSQLVGGLDKNDLKILLDTIEADAIIVHLNVLQELMQPEGDRKFKGIESGIKQLVQDSPVPVMIKETGAGISGKVAQRLIDCGVHVVDIAGAGGTSWSSIENKRLNNPAPQEIFDDWGIPTAQCLQEIQQLHDRGRIEVIASGGIRNSFDIAKALGLGADFAASAGPVIKAVVNDGFDGLEALYLDWKKQLKTILCLLGCSWPAKLQRDMLVNKK